MRKVFRVPRVRLSLNEVSRSRLGERCETLHRVVMVDIGQVGCPARNRAITVEQGTQKSLSDGTSVRQSGDLLTVARPAVLQYVVLVIDEARASPT